MLRSVGWVSAALGLAFAVRLGAALLPTLTDPRVTADVHDPPLGA